MRKCLPILAAVLALAACSQVIPSQPTPTTAPTQPVLAAPTQTEAPAIDQSILGTTLNDVVYCTSPEGVPLKMDIRYPASGQPPFPVVIYVHGGGWSEGSKENISTDSWPTELVPGGNVLVSINYRLAPEYPFPAQIIDTKCAIRSLRAQAEEYQLDPERFATWGDSAGGHLVALTGLADENPDWDSGEWLEESSQVQAVIDWYGVHDISSDNMRGALGMFRRVFKIQDGSDPLALTYSPVSYVSANDAPMLLLHGLMDTTVPYQQSQELYDLLVENSVPAQLVLVENAGHRFAADQYGQDPSSAELFEIMQAFLNEHLGK